MGLITTIQNKTEQVRAKERIRPLLESRMMRDILLEIGAAPLSLHCSRYTTATGGCERVYFAP